MRVTLADDVFFCLAQGHGVFLDLRRDHYSAVPLKLDPDGANGTASLARTLMGSHGDELKQAGLLVAGGHSPRGLSDYLAIPRPSGQADGLFDRRAFGPVAHAPATPAPIDVYEVLSACRSAAHKLRRWPILKTVNHVRMRKASGLRTGVTPEGLAREVDIFARVRPWYPRDYLCLFDSLALIDFLGRRGVYPDWIFGVQVQPFAAHCWVQSGDRLLNETLDFASQFTPIMMV